MGSNNNPFGNSIKYTKPPAIFLAYIQIDGETAANGDTVAIYVGEELRCVQIVQLVQNFSIITGNVQMLNDSETITKIEIWDASENVILEVPNFTLEILFSSINEQKRFFANKTKQSSVSKKFN